MGNERTPWVNEAGEWENCGKRPKRWVDGEKGVKNEARNEARDCGEG
jgi:hypothetical protein